MEQLDIINVTQGDQDYSVLSRRFLVLGSLFQTSVQRVIRTDPFSLFLVDVTETCQGRCELQEMLKKCFISHVVGNDCSSYVKSFCLVTTEPMMGFTIILLDPGWTALEELMSKVRTIFGQLQKSQRIFWAGTNKLLVLTTELCQRHMGTPGFHIASISQNL